MLAHQEDWSKVTKPNQPQSYSAFSKAIEKSQNDDRDYRIIRLENGLTATLIHDPTADKAAASLDVAVGHLYDPDDMPGLAHFCEHLLFMGTETYPKENEYSEFLATNNGSSNAYTSTSNTNYHFSVATPALSGALSRFSAFFHCPLFSPSCTSRELNAVDSEHKKNHQADMWRIFQLNKHLTKPGHVWNKFGSGNRESLSKAGKQLKSKGKLHDTPSQPVLDSNGNVTPSETSAQASLAPSPIPSRISSPAPSIASTGSDTEADGGVVGRETRRRLVEWWSKEYCASRMNLCVIGKESLDDLAAMVTELFSPVQNRGQDPLPMINDHPFGPGETGRVVSVKTIMAFHAVEVSFPLDYQPPLWKYKPGNFVAHFVGHEGRGSLHSYLKNKGWITSLSAGPQPLGRGFAMFKVTIHLTNAGFANYREVVLATFKYLSLLRSSELEPWHQQEISMMYRTRFRFKEKSRPEKYAVWVSEHMSWPVIPDRLLTAPQLTWEWDEQEKPGGLQQVREVLETLTADRGRVVLMAKGEEHARITSGDVTWQKEPIYGTEYKVDMMEKDFLERAQGPNDIPELFLPGPNEFMPTNLEVAKRDVAEPSRRPHIVRETPLSTLWHKKDDQFWVPKANVIIEIRTPFANDSPRNAVLTRLYTDLVTDSLTEFSYDADLAGLEYQFASHSLGLFITLSGYNDKLPVLARQILEKARALEVNSTRLSDLKEEAVKNWENFFQGQTYRISDYYGRYLMSDQQWTVEEKLDVLKPTSASAQAVSTTSEDVQQHIGQLFSKLNIRILVNGNLFKDEAIKMAEMVEDVLCKPSHSQSISPTDVIDRALMLPEATNYIWATSARNPNEPNSALTYFMYTGSRTSSKLLVTANLLNQLISEPAFNVLRTKEQLGYIVHCSPWPLAGSGQGGIRIVIQSEKSPAYLESRVEAFLGGMKTTIEEMSEEKFEEQKDGLYRKLTEKVKTVAEETNIFWSHIDSGYLDFYRRAEDAASIKSITKDAILEMFMSRIHPFSQTRSKLSVHCRSVRPRLSHAAASAFADIAREAGITSEESAWQEALGSETPAVADFLKYWQGLVVGSQVKPEVAQPVFVRLPALMAEHPAPEVDAERREGVSYIDDVHAFKSALAKSEVPKPLVEWNDLPTSKF